MNEQLKLSNQICHRFYMATNSITRAYKPYLNRLDITYPQYLVLMALWEKDDIEMSQVQRQTQIDAGALTLIMKKLVSKEVVELNTADHDKRVKLVKLTEKGREMELKAADIPKSLRCQFPDFTEQEMNQLILLLDKLNSSLSVDDE